MALENEWVNYIQRSYLDIKNSVLTKITNVAPEITDHSESNVLVVIVSIFSGIAEMLGYYIDNMARETFIATARRFSSGVKLAVMYNYRIQSSVMSFVDLTVTFNSPATANYILTQGKVFQTSNGVIFFSDADVEINIGDTEALLTCRQGVVTNGVDLGLTDNSIDQTFFIHDEYADDTAQVKINGIIWERVDTFAYSTNIDKHFIVIVSIDKKAYVQFGDGINGAIPPSGYPVIADFFITQGALGNVDANTITTINSTLNIPGTVESDLEVTNELQSTGGNNTETIDSLRRRIPLSLRTLLRAVTRQDYIDLALMSQGVKFAAVLFDCGKTVDIYISPITGGIAPLSLLNNTYDYLYPKRMITTFINVLPAGESYIVLELDVTLKFRVDPILGEDAIRNALNDNYGFTSSDINRPVRVSDIYAIVDNLEEVDYLGLNILTYKPYARPRLQATPQLDWDPIINQASTSTSIWQLKYINNGGNDFELLQDNSFSRYVNIGVPATTFNGVLTLTINAGAYTIGDQWFFQTLPVNQNLEFNDYTVPILLDTDLTLIIHEQVTNN